MATMHDNNETVAWPKRAVVTAGMPYGNKPLHFGHIAGVFVPATASRASCVTASARRTSASSAARTASVRPSTRATASWWRPGSSTAPSRITCCATTTARKTRWIPMTSALISTKDPTSGIPARSTSSSARRSSRSCMRTAGCRSARRCSSTTPRPARS